MSERITDERLAEIEHRWTNDGWILDSDGFAIIEALKAERAKLAERQESWREHVTGLHSQILTLEEERDDLCAALSGQTDRAVVAEAKLRGANAEIERQKGLVRNYLETIEGNEIDIAGLLEKLRAVVSDCAACFRTAAEDIQSWGEYADAYFQKKHGLKAEVERYRNKANELEALLKTNDESRTRPIQGGYLEKDTTTGEVHEPTTERDWTSDAWSK